MIKVTSEKKYLDSTYFFPSYKKAGRWIMFAPSEFQDKIPVVIETILEGNRQMFAHKEFITDREGKELIGIYIQAATARELVIVFL